jgi:(E)-4-hydroxy-3-methylbut-2-enyl-diphosphate synthase
MVEKAEALLRNIRKPLRVAIMGCVVNGPGEAKEADVGIAGGRESGILFKKGKRVEKVPESDLLDRLLSEVERMTGEKIRG